MDEAYPGQRQVRFRSCLLGTGMVLLPLLLGAASAFPVNYTGNDTTLNGSWDWQASTGATLNFTSGDLSGLSVRANGSEVWNWSQRANVTGVVWWRTVMVDFPDQRDLGFTLGWSGEYERMVWFGPTGAKDEVWVRYVPGSSNNAGYLNFTAAQTVETVNLDTVTWNNSRYNFSANRTVHVLNQSPGLGYWIPLGPNGTLLDAPPQTGQSAHITGGSGPQGGYGAAFAWTSRPSGPPYLVTLGSAALPIRINSTENFTVSGTVSTDEIYVWPWAMVVGQNVSATVNLTGALNFTLDTENWTAIKPGTYSLNARRAGLQCQAGASQVTLTTNRSYPGCVIIASPPNPVNRPSSAPAASSGGGGGSASEPSSPDPAPPPPEPPRVVSPGSPSVSHKTSPVAVSPESPAAHPQTVETSSGVVVVVNPIYGEYREVLIE